MKSVRLMLSAAALLGVMTSAAQAQFVIEPMVGGYLPVSDLGTLPGSVNNLADKRDGTLSLGGNVSFSFLRVSAAYATGTTIKDHDQAELGKGSVLAVSGDIVIRPIPRIFVQPYLIAGAGKKFYNYDPGTNFTADDNNSQFALHGGVGLDLVAGPIGVVVEVQDFVSKNADDKYKVHDSFVMAGLRIPL